MLTKQDLIDLGLTPGPIFASIFKATKSCETKEAALEIAKAIAAGTFQKAEHKKEELKPDSVLAWLLEFKWCPSTQQEVNASNSEKRRMLENKAITLWGIKEDSSIPCGQGRFTLTEQKPGPNDPMPDFIIELTFFKGSKRQCSMFWEPAFMALVL